MFPFHRKLHNNSISNSKQLGKQKSPLRNGDGMSDSEYLEYIHNNDNSRHQLTSIAHDRYCNTILREKEDILLSALHCKEDEQLTINITKVEEDNINSIDCDSSVLKDFGNLNQRNCSISLPPSPPHYKSLIGIEHSINRRKSDTLAVTRKENLCSATNFKMKQQNEYVMTLKIDDVESDTKKSQILKYKILPPKGDLNSQEIGQSNSNVHSSKQKDQLNLNREVIGNGKETQSSRKKYPVRSSVIVRSRSLQGLNSPLDLTISRHIITSNHAEMTPIINNSVDLETSIALKSLLLGSATNNFSHQWLEQSFTFNSTQQSKWQLIQLKAGCCGVVASVEAHIIKALLFDPSFSKCREPLHPSKIELSDSLIYALSSILWKAGDFQKAVLLTPPLNKRIPKNDSECYVFDGITDTFTYTIYKDFNQLKSALILYLKFFTSPPNHGYLNFIICVVLSRGIERVKRDMDDECTSLITENGHCSLELVMLLLMGQAISNVFDNYIRIDSCLLKGVTTKSDIGFLSFYEHLNDCEVGVFLKTPAYPIWLINHKNHFTILFSSKAECVNDDISKPFILHHYDSLSVYEHCPEINLIVDPKATYCESNKYSSDTQTDLQLCVKTKWPNATVVYAENSDLYLI